MALTANSVITPQTPKSATVNLTTANTTFTPGGPPTNTVLLVTAGVNGARLTRLHAIPCETIGTANNIQLYRSTDAGVTKYLADSKLMATVTPGAAVANDKTDFGFSDDNPLILLAAERIYMAEGQSKSVNAIAEWADY